MPDSEYEPESSVPLDRTVGLVRINAFVEARECAIIREAGTWVKNHATEILEDPVEASVFSAFFGGVEAAATIPRVHRTGVFDYDSLVECLKSNFERALPELPFRDPQDAIQQLAAELMHRRGFIEAVKHIGLDLDRDQRQSGTEASTDTNCSNAKEAGDTALSELFKGKGFI